MGKQGGLGQPISLALFITAAVSLWANIVYGFPIAPYARSDEEWAKRCQGVRTSYNPHRDLSNEELTITPEDERFEDFLYWVWNNKLTEHQVEQFGGTLWEGPKTGVIFHWAPGSYWEKHTVASFGLTIGHVTGEHGWVDTMFPDFFEKHGGTYGALVKDRLYEIDPNSPRPWVEFLEYGGGPNSPLYRYLFHQEAIIDLSRKRVIVGGGQGVGFEYTYERYLGEIREVLTDCKAYEFFQLYDRYGRGFASRGGWAGNHLQGESGRVIYGTGERKASQPRLPPALSKRAHNPSPRPGKVIYNRECAPCHGLSGKGDGVLAYAMDPPPRDFTTGKYKVRSTPSGMLPTDQDLFRVTSRGIVGTTMPGWSQFLSEQDRWEVVEYIKTFSERFAKEKAPGPISIGKPLPSSPQSLARGKELYQALGCVECHGEAGRGDGPSAPTLKDDWGYPIKATDLTDKWRFKGGFSAEDLYRTVMTGFNGTPMPSYADALEREEDRWALVNYLLSLSPAGRPKVKPSPSTRVDQRGPKLSH